jgi:hypothetical protein
MDSFNRTLTGNYAPSENENGAGQLFIDKKILVHLLQI